MANQNSKSKNKKNTTKASTNSKKVTSNKDVKKDTKVVAKSENKKVEAKKVNNKKVEAKKDVKKEVSKIEVPKFEKKEKGKVHEKTSSKSKFSLTAKQKDIILIALVVVLLIVAAIVTGNKDSKVDIELPVALEGDAGFNEITYSNYLEKIDSNEPFLVVIVKDGCGYCEMYEPILKEVADEYNLPINYINLTNLSEEEYNDLAQSNAYLKKNQWGTPTTLFMLGDSVIDSIGGYVDKDKFVDFVKENFVVNEDAE
mgnify:FL=1